MWRSPASSAHLRHLLRRLLRRLLPSRHLTSSVRSLSSQFHQFDPSHLPPSPTSPARSPPSSSSSPPEAANQTAWISRATSPYISPTSDSLPLLLEILNASPASGRVAADLYRWIVRSRSFTPSDESLSYLLLFLGRRKDFRSFLNLVSDFKSAFGPKSFAATVDCLVCAGRGTQAVRFFDSMMVSSTAGLSVQSSMVAPFAGLKSTFAFPVTCKLAIDFSQLPSNGGRVQCMKVWLIVGLKKFETLSA